MDFESIIKSAILGVIQGLTEFLPISSSGHLAVANKIFPGQDFNLQFTLILHFGTMMATIWVFWDEIIALFLSLGKIPQSIKEKKWDKTLRLAALIVVASIPTAIIGLFFRDYFEVLEGNIKLVGAMFLITAALLLSTRFIKAGEQNEENFSFWKALVVGLVQGLAITPGISRSGSTISASVILKGDREFAGRFSFLMSLPAIFAANVLELVKLRKDGVCPINADGSLIANIIGFITAFLVGFFALKILLKLVKGGKFYYFAFYCLLIGIITLIFIQ